jgi:hypothetical protein
MAVDCDLYGPEMTRTLTTVIALSGLLLLNPALSRLALAADGDDEDRWYQVELIVFENKKSVDATEVWSEDPGQADMDQALELLKPVTEHTQAAQDLITPPPLATVADTTVIDAGETTPVTEFQAFELLPERLLALGDSIERLNTSEDYQPLLHIGWRQHVPERNDAQPIAIDSRKLLLYTTRFSDNTEDPSGGNQQETGAADAMPPPPLYEQGPDEIVTEINQNFVTGTLTLTRGRYLHLDIDLLFQRQPNTPQLFSFFGFGNAGNTPERYRMTQQRRLKRNELHYFDQPKFGVLVMVTAVEQDDPDQVQTIPLNRPR